MFVFKCHAWHDCRRACAHTHTRTQTHTHTRTQTHPHQDTRTRFFFHMPLWPHGALYIPRTLPSTLCCSITPKTNSPIQETPAIVKSLGLLGPIRPQRKPLKLQAYNNHLPHGLLAQYKEGLRTGVRSTVIHDLKNKIKKIFFFSFSDLLSSAGTGIVFLFFFWGGGGGWNSSPICLPLVLCRLLALVSLDHAFLWFCVVSWPLLALFMLLMCTTYVLQ